MDELAHAGEVAELELVARNGVAQRADAEVAAHRRLIAELLDHLSLRDALGDALGAEADVAQGGEDDGAQRGADVVVGAVARVGEERAELVGVVLADADAGKPFGHGSRASGARRGSGTWPGACAMRHLPKESAQSTRSALPMALEARQARWIS